LSKPDLKRPSQARKIENPAFPNNPLHTPNYPGIKILTFNQNYSPRSKAEQLIFKRQRWNKNRGLWTGH